MGAHETARVSRWLELILPPCCSKAISVRKGIVLAPSILQANHALLTTRRWQRATALRRVSTLRSLPRQSSMRRLKIVAARQRRVRPFRGRLIMCSRPNALEGHVSAFANLPISRKLLAAFAAVVVVIFVSSAIVYDRLRVIEWAKNMRVE